jgi:hypothetical protein
MIKISREIVWVERFKGFGLIVFAAHSYSADLIQNIWVDTVKLSR